MDQDRIFLDHGSGGRLTNDLIAEMMLPAFHNPILSQMEDGASFDVAGCRLAFSTDSYVVDPIFFPGGNIGDLAVNGTVNDLAMCGARPQYISVGLILEEGLPVADLERVLDSMKAAAESAVVRIVTGDTKVVPRGKADKIFINTAGIGVFEHHLEILGSGARPGDKVLINGTMGDHGMAVLASREGLELQSDIPSDSAALN